MYEVSNELAAALAEQRLYTRVRWEGQTLEADQIMELHYSTSCGGEDVITIGGVTAATVRMSVLGRWELVDEEITVEVGTVLSDEVTYLPLGTFMVTECQMGENTTAFTGYDAAYYGMGVEYVPAVGPDPTVAQVLADVARQCGLTLAPLPSGGLAGQAIRETVIRTSVIGQDALTGYTCREMAGYMAGLVGYNVIVDRTGALALRWFDACDCRVTGEDYYSGGLTLDGEYRMGFIACTVPVRSTVESQTTRVLREGHGSTGITMENPFMTMQMMRTLFLLIGGQHFRTGSLSMIGGLLLEPGDAVLVREPDWTSYRFPAQVLELTIDGGCRATLRTNGKSGTETSANVAGSVTGALRNVSSNVAAVSVAQSQTAGQVTALQTSVQTLEAEKADVTDLNAANANITRLSAEKADVTDLNATNAQISNLSAGKADVADLNAAAARITTLETQKADVTDLQAANASISSLEAGKADIDLANIQNGCITTAMLGQGVVGTAQIADASVTDAKIVGLTANKITAGTLDAGTIDVVNLNAANITVGTINGTQIAPGAIGTTQLDSAVSGAIASNTSGVQQALTQAGLAVTTAQGAAQTAQAAQNAVGQAVSIANGKTTAYYAAAQPAGSDFQVNDIWFDTDDGFKMYYWNGTAWTAATYGESAISGAAVTADKLAASAVTAGKIASGAVTADKIAANAVTAGKIAADAVTSGTIASGAVSAGNLAAGAVTADKVAAGAISSTHLTSGAVTADKIVSGAVTTDKLDAAAVQTNNLAAGAVTTAKLNSGAVTTEKLDAGAVTAAKLAAGAVTADKLAAGAVTAGKIDSGAVTTDKLAAGAVTASKIDVNDLFAQNITATGTIQGARLVGATISGSLDIMDLPTDCSVWELDEDSVVDSGSIVVLSRLGWVQINGYVKLKVTSGDYHEVLYPGRVPAPHDPYTITPTIASWKSASALPARIRVGAYGGLYIKGGEGGHEYNFSITYPEDTRDYG